jgi:hypothetical protein
MYVVEDVASYYALLGNKDQAFLSLNKGCQERSSGFLGVIPLFETLRSDPHYTGMIRPMRLISN